MGLKILGRVGTHIFFNYLFPHQGFVLFDMINHFLKRIVFGIPICNPIKYIMDHPVAASKVRVKDFITAELTLNALIATKAVCSSRLLKGLRSLYGKQFGPIGAVWSGFMLFASILNSSVMLDNYLQQTTSADNIFKCIFSWRFKG